MAVAHDAGGARALIPVARELLARGAILTTVVSGPADAIWRSEGTGTLITRPDAMDIDEAARLLSAARADVLLSASGLYNEIEHTMRLAARTLGVRVVAVLDSWGNYAERFERWRDGTIVRSPADVICAIDQRTARAVAHLAPRVVLTGPPQLEDLMRRWIAIGAAERSALRSAAGLGESDLVIVFFSDPFYTGPDGHHVTGPGALIGDDGRSLYGYTSATILAEVIQDLDAALVDQRRSAHLVVRPHPAEHDAPLREVIDRIATSMLAVSLSTGGDRLGWIARADVAVGMMSIILLEAAIVGRAAVSFQMGLPASGSPDPSVGNLLGYTVAVYDRAGSRRVSRAIARGDAAALRASPREPLAMDGSIARAAEVVLGA